MLLTSKKEGIYMDNSLNLIIFNNNYLNFNLKSISQVNNNFTSFYQFFNLIIEFQVVITFMK